MEMKAPEQQGCEGKSKWPFQALLWSQVQQNSPGDEVINFCPSKVFCINSHKIMIE